MKFFKRSVTQKISRLLLVSALALTSCNKEPDNRLQISPNSHIVMIGNNLCSRMINFGHFETELQLRYPKDSLFIRNMCDGGNTPGFRPHSARKSPWAFPGAEKFYPNELSNDSGSIGHFPTEDEWLTELKADIIIAFFGYNESFNGAEGLENYKNELRAFIQHTKNQKYNGTSAPQLALVSPIAFEDLSDEMDLPDGVEENKNLKMYTEAMREVAAEDGVLFVDAFSPSKSWMETETEHITADGFQLNDLGYKKLADLLADNIFGADKASKADRTLVNEAVNEKNWFWHNDFKIPNGVHAYGRRYDPFGPDNYPFEIEKIRQMTAIRDTAIWASLGRQENGSGPGRLQDPKTPSRQDQLQGEQKKWHPRIFVRRGCLGKNQGSPGLQGRDVRLRTRVSRSGQPGTNFL